MSFGTFATVGDPATYRYPIGMLANINSLKAYKTRATGRVQEAAKDTFYRELGTRQRERNIGGGAPSFTYIPIGGIGNTTHHHGSGSGGSGDDGQKREWVIAIVAAIAVGFASWFLGKNQAAINETHDILRDIRADEDLLENITVPETLTQAQQYQMSTVLALANTIVEKEGQVHSDIERTLQVKRALKIAIVLSLAGVITGALIPSRVTLIASFVAVTVAGCTHLGYTAMDGSRETRIRDKANEIKQLIERSEEVGKPAGFSIELKRLNGLFVVDPSAPPAYGAWVS